MAIRAMSQELEVVVLGGANVDYLIRGPALPAPGSTIEGDEFQEAPGGKGANQAVAAARLGASVAFVGRIGSDARGRSVLDNLKAEGVDTSELSIDPGAPTGIALVMVNGAGEKQIMTAPGANRRLTRDHVVNAAPLIERARVLLLELEVPIEALKAGVRLARPQGVPVVLDFAPPSPLAKTLLQNIDVIRANADEAKVLTGLTITDTTTARRAAHHLLGQGVGAAVLGAPGGNLLVSADGELWLPHLEVEVVDATGAGDAFAAALAVCLACGKDLFEAARFASAAAALKTTKLGAQAGLPRREAVEELLLRTQSAS